jgi:LacI family gluconate utilization system Gnt-I transcriptional repressor
LVLTRSRLRLRGYKGALREAGISFAEDIILESAAGYGAGAEAMSRLLAIRPRVDAAFFAGDVLAIGGLLECQRRRVSVPSRIAIAGFDDLEMSSQLVPSLTVLRIPRYEIGREAARSILERLSGNSGERSNTIDVGFSVLEREST